MFYRTLFAGFLGVFLLGSIGCCCADRCAARPAIVGSAPICCPNNCNGAVAVPPQGSAVVPAPPPGAIIQ